MAAAATAAPASDLQTVRRVNREMLIGVPFLRVDGCAAIMHSAARNGKPAWRPQQCRAEKPPRPSLRPPESLRLLKCAQLLQRRRARTSLPAACLSAVPKTGTRVALYAPGVNSPTAARADPAACRVFRSPGVVNVKEDIMSRKLLLLALLAGCATGAQAAEPGLYLGAGIGQAGIEVDGNDPETGEVNFDGDDVGYKLFAGFRFVDWFGVEAAWNDFGKADDSTDVGGVPIETEFETDGFDVNLVGMVPLGERFDIFAKAGYFVWDAEGRSTAFPGGRVKTDGEDLTYGVGVQGFLLDNFGLRAEYQIYDVDGIDDAWFLNASAILRF
jgi:OOP family OmpA-OmpF porin